MINYILYVKDSKTNDTFLSRQLSKFVRYSGDAKEWIISITIFSKSDIINQIQFLLMSRYPYNIVNFPLRSAPQYTPQKSEVSYQLNRDNFLVKHR